MRVDASQSRQRRWLCFSSTLTTWSRATGRGLVARTHHKNQYACTCLQTRNNIFFELQLPSRPGRRFDVFALVLAPMFLGVSQASERPSTQEAALEREASDLRAGRSRAYPEASDPDVAEGTGQRPGVVRSLQVATPLSVQPLCDSATSVLYVPAIRWLQLMDSAQVEKRLWPTCQKSLEQQVASRMFQLSLLSTRVYHDGVIQGSALLEESCEGRAGPRRSDDACRT